MVKHFAASLAFRLNMYAHIGVILFFFFGSCFLFSSSSFYYILACKLNSALHCLKKWTIIYHVLKSGCSETVLLSHYKHIIEML